MFADIPSNVNDKKNDPDKKDRKYPLCSGSTFHTLLPSSTSGKSVQQAEEKLNSFGTIPNRLFLGPWNT